MINVKDQIYSALSAVVPNTSDAYPKSWAEFPAVQITEEENSVMEWADNQEQKAYIRYRVDIWHNKSTSLSALKVDAAISALGLRRTACQDVEDPAGWKHKMMRYEGIIDVRTEQVYQNH